MSVFNRAWGKARNALGDFGPSFLVALAIMMAAAFGDLHDGFTWYLLIPAGIAGCARSWAETRAKEAEQRRFANLLVSVLSRGSDTTITIEHSHSSRPSTPEGE